MPESNLRKLSPFLSDRDYMHGQCSKEIQHTFLNSLWNEDMLNENHVGAKVYPSYKNMTLVQGLSSLQVNLQLHNSDEINNYIWGQNRELSRYLFYILIFLLLSLLWMMCCFKRWTLNLSGFFNFFHFLFYPYSATGSRLKWNLRGRVVQFERQHELEEKIGGFSKNVILLFLYIVTVVKSCISTRTKQFSATPMTMLKLLLCFSFDRCSSPPPAFTNLNGSSSTL